MLDIDLQRSQIAGTPLELTLPLAFRKKSWHPRETW
jgi:hypothetical protein